ncbi:MAG: phosphoglycerate dehydrogenase [Porticoccaceae bacterium]|jgi:D-3-phosphoglycerate dehydrogenase / 2-oxoglutarate reductase|nr:phosphoglycerate dehydrogenase [Porticoccaceae bacterium]
MYKVQTYNAISDKGLSRFPADSYEVGSELDAADAYILRSHKLHDQEVPSSLVAVARAGAGTNNVPVEDYSAKGIVVFNTPGANANAVKELVLTGILMSCRDIAGGIEFVRNVEGVTDEAEMAKLLEQEKKKFAGSEIKGKTLGVIGLGAIGALVANVATELGMNVVGFDPAISVEAAWRLSRRVEKMESVEALMSRADFITVHVPAIPATKGLINSEKLALCKEGTVLLNFAREQVVDEAAVIAALDSGKLHRFVTDFPTLSLAKRRDVIQMPHIGASTAEAEENCAVMAADQLMDYLENGNIKNSVNFPATSMARNGGSRITVANDNVPAVLGNVLSILADANLNIIDMLNRSRDELAYNIIDVEGDVKEGITSAIGEVEGVTSVRLL